MASLESTYNAPTLIRAKKTVFFEWFCENITKVRFIEDGGRWDPRPGQDADISMNAGYVVVSEEKCDDGKYLEQLLSFLFLCLTVRSLCQTISCENGDEKNEVG